MKVRLALVVCLVALMFTSTLLAEAPPAPSARKATFALTMPGARAGKMTVREGQMGRMERESDGLTIGFAARVLNDERVQLSLVDITRGADGVEQHRLLRTIELQAGEPSIVVSTAPDRERGPRVRGDARQNTDVSIEIGLIGIDLPTPANASARCATRALQSGEAKPGDVRSDGPCSRCCITCDGWRACGCAVEMCGFTCCCDPCC